MPTFRKRQDGCGILIGSYEDNFVTWQVSAAGVWYLQRRGVREGDAVSPALVTQLRERGYIHTGATPALAAPILNALEIPLDLRAVISQFHSLLHKGDVAGASALLWAEPNDDETETGAVTSTTTLPRIFSWALQDNKPWRLQRELRDGSLTDEEIATVTLTLRLQSTSGDAGEPFDKSEYWIKTTDGWRLVRPSAWGAV